MIQVREFVDMLWVKQFLERRALKKMKIDASRPRKSGVTRVKRQQEIIISLTSHPPRIGSAYKTVRTLLHQDVLPDRVLLWLAREQFPDKKIPRELLELQRFGLEIRWYHDIRSYKKLIPALREHPDALIITADDDWYYRTDMLRVLLEEHRRYPQQVICHAATGVRFVDENKLTADSPLEGAASFLNMALGGSGTLYPPGVLDQQVLDEKLFMETAPTNDDIWFWAMAVKKGTRIRLPETALGLALMTDDTVQNLSALAAINTPDIYEALTNLMPQMFPQIMENLRQERLGRH